MVISRSSRITLLLVIDILFFLTELIVGGAMGSLALVADSIPMLNDAMTLIVALYAIKLTNGNSADPRYSYGWHRTEILAELVNGVFVLALCFSVCLKAIGQFFTATPDISNPKLVIIFGSLGLASSIVGPFLFHDHHDSHFHIYAPKHATPSSSASSVVHVQDDGGLGSGAITPTQKQYFPGSPSSSQVPHSPASSFSSLYGHPAATRAYLVQTANEMASAPLPTTVPRRVWDSPQPNETLTENTPLLHNEDGRSHKRSHRAQGSMNMRALIFHVIGNALGKVGVILTGLVSTWEYDFYCDPVISLVITIITLQRVLPLVRSASFILLQGVPPTVSLEEVKESILKVEGVLSLHELHVWQLSKGKIVASLHVLASRNHDFMPVVVKIRKVLHHLGIHSCTVQPEYHPTTRVQYVADSSCLILCPADEECNPFENACCPPPPVDA